MSDFRPFFTNAHLATIAGNFWKRNLDLARFPARPTVWSTEPGVQVMAMSHEPGVTPCGELFILHGLEGSHDSGYCQSLAQTALEHRFRVHRLNMRGCGGTEELSKTLYHAGLTADLRAILEQRRTEGGGPFCLAGFSLGGNVVLKLAGELGDRGRELLAAVAAVSTPIDLHACCLELRRRKNRLYEERFVKSLKERYRRRAQAHPDLYVLDGLDEIRTVIAFDDRITARYFGFGSAERYYALQSSAQFIPEIRVPTLVIQAKDDPMIPFPVYEQARLDRNSHVRLRATAHGGHVGFIARERPRFWVDQPIVEFFSSQVSAAVSSSTR